MADEIAATMKRAGFTVREADPFDPAQTLTDLSGTVSPVAARIKAFWNGYRDAVHALAPPSPGLPQDTDAYLKSVDDIYKSDAYHSLSIEGYTVTLELIDRVRTGQWNPEINEADRKNRDALAARGYWQAFQSVKASVADIIHGADPGQLVKRSARSWYAELFQPSVAAGLIKATALAGYRSIPVYLRGSRHVPPRWESIPDAMNTLFALIENEPDAFVRAVLGHWMVGYLHPYPDGNGRTARFLMNAMLASGGFNWLVIRVDDRAAYLAALEDASVGGDITPFARFIAKQVSVPKP
jgi:Fic family protein